MLYNQWKYNRAKYSTADLEDGSLTVVADSTSSADSYRIRESGSITMGDTVIFAVSSKIVNAESDIVATSSTISDSIRVRESSASSVVTSGYLVNAEKIHLTAGQLTATGQVIAKAQVIYNGSAETQEDSIVTAICNRVQQSSAVSDGVSVTITIGREKWEDIINSTTSWSVVAESTDTWADIPESTDTWTTIAA